MKSNTLHLPWRAIPAEITPEEAASSEYSYTILDSTGKPIADVLKGKNDKETALAFALAGAIVKIETGYSVETGKRIEK